MKLHTFRRYQHEGRRTIRVLGCGGDYEDWPCPKCRPAEYNRPDATEYYDGEAD